MDKDLKCISIHYNNPYLRFGPFKFELKHHDPEIVVIHDFLSLNIIQQIKTHAQGKMISTPYNVGPKYKGFSKGRTSKVMYLNEKLVAVAMQLSRKIELATKVSLSHEQFSSENFQIMNYGIGGKISAHVDSPGIIYGKNYTYDDGKYSK